MSDWCILRTSGRATLSLAASLSNAGFDVWTPIQIEQRRTPRSKAKVEWPAPIMPTFVFARADCMPEMLALSKTAVKAHADFSVFRFQGRIPLLKDYALEPLRTAERRVTPITKRRPFRKGETVRIPEGSFAGMSGVVQQDDGRYTLVCFGGRVQVKIATFLLQQDVANKPQPVMGTAAQAA